jgi:hypothetical protein
MSPRDTYCFFAGAASGLMVGGFGVYLLAGSPASGTRAAAAGGATITNTSDLLMPGDRWPTLAEAQSTKQDSSPATGANAGSLEEVTRSLAQRLATKGGTDDEWRLLAQSYDYMGRTNDARAARMHSAAPESDAATKTDPTAANTARERVADTTQGSRISGTVRIAADLAAGAAVGATLFVYATDAAAPGPPLAVLRLRVDRWPVSYVLDDADAMIPGRNLSAARRVKLEARISPSGEALPRPGDLVGNIADVDPHTRQPVNISIDHKISG